MFIRSLSSAMLVFVLAGPLCLAQSDQPSAPTPQQIPSAPAAQTAPAEPFPPVDPANFTAASPTKEDVEAFLKTSWGYDPNRVWEVFKIEKTEAAGVSKVTILVSEKQPGAQVS